MFRSNIILPSLPQDRSLSWLICTITETKKWPITLHKTYLGLWNSTDTQVTTVSNSRHSSKCTFLLSSFSASVWKSSKDSICYSKVILSIKLLNISKTHSRLSHQTSLREKVTGVRAVPFGSDLWQISYKPFLSALFLNEEAQSQKSMSSWLTYNQ